uniref:hypothetical protein n=1 Tax=Catenuloplanes japonicus TaxID=33876 RepID=UPI0012F71080|nr:hypothetical protein [Catenuloplanes japonicus]
MTMRLTVIAAAAAGEAAPSVSATATISAISSMTRRMTSIHISILAASMSQPHSSTILPTSSEASTSISSAASSPAAIASQAWRKARPVAPVLPYPLMKFSAPEYASCIGPCSAFDTEYHSSARSQTAASLPSGHSTPTTHSSPS